MKKHFGMIILAVLVVVALLITTVAVKVNALTDIVLIKTFGRVDKVIIGSQDAGLKFKLPWPVQQAVRYDSRIFVFEDTGHEMATRDKQSMIMTMYCAWKISPQTDDIKKFHSSVKTTVEAEKSIRDYLGNVKSTVVGSRNMEDFINTDPQKMKIPQIEEEIQQKVRDYAKQYYGVEIVSVGVKSFGMPEAVTNAVIDAMKEERQKEVKRLESAGKAQATAIRERARAARDQILEFAKRTAADISSEGDRAAAKYYKEFAASPQLSIFLRSLESLRKELQSKTVILLDGSELPAVKYFSEGPSLPELKSPGRTKNEGGK